MTIKELKEKIATMPDSMDVVVSERKTETRYGLVNSAYVKTITIADEEDCEDTSFVSVLVLDEE